MDTVLEGKPEVAKTIRADQGASEGLHMVDNSGSSPEETWLQS